MIPAPPPTKKSLHLSSSLATADTDTAANASDRAKNLSFISFSILILKKHYLQKTTQEERFRHQRLRHRDRDRVHIHNVRVPQDLQFPHTLPD